MKNLLLVLSLVITASPAFASRARLEALGEGKNGSYYINDGRNIFLNPAAINGYKKKLFLELGQATTVADAAAPTAANTQTANAADTGSKVQGGFTNTFGDFTYGLFLGKESDRLANQVALLNSMASMAGASALVAPDHALEFFFGGEASSLKYGMSLMYAGNFVKSTAGVKNTASLFGIKLGVDTNNLNVFTTLGLSSSVKTFNESLVQTSNELKGKLSLDLGVTYAMDDMTYLAKFTSTGADFTQSAAGGATDTLKTTAFGLGAGWKKEASKSVTMYSRIQLDYQKNSLSDENGNVNAAADTALTGNETWYNLPLVLAAEAQATSWLTVRGSISHSLFGQHQRVPMVSPGVVKDSLAGMTTVAMGLGFNFGDLTIDALAGQAAALTGAASESSMGVSQAGSKFGFGDNMVSRLAMTYNF